MTNAYQILLGILSVFEGQPGNLLPAPKGMSNEEDLLYRIYRNLVLGFNAGGGGGGGTFTSDINVVLSGGKTLGKYGNGEVIPAAGQDIETILNDIATEFLAPAFSGFDILTLGSTFEVGATISGIQVFAWSVSNPGNVVPTSGILRDVTNAVDLQTGFDPTGGGTVQDIGVIQKTIEDSHIWSVELEDTEGGTDVETTAINWAYLQFYGPTAADPTDSATTRALPNNRFNNLGNTFNLNTGTVEVKYALAVPFGRTLSQVIDLDALNTDITSQYIDSGFVFVNDNGGAGTPTPYQLYVMTQAVPYTSNHRHQITLS